MKNLLQVRIAMRRTQMAVWLVSLMAAASVVAQEGTVAAFMKIHGVTGESGDPKFAGWSRLTDVVGEAAAPSSPDPATPPAAAMTLHVFKRIDKSSPLLAKACGDGSVFPIVSFVWADKGSVFFRVTLKEVMVSSCKCLATVEAPPSEEVSFTFQKIEWSCMTDLGPDGGLLASFDLLTQQGAQKVRPLFHADLQREAAARPGVRLICPVEAGHRYRISGNTSLNGDWVTIQEFEATDDGQVEQFLPLNLFRLFLRVEALD